MLPSFQRGDRQRAMHIGPGSDAHSVDGLILQQLLPAVVHRGDVELVCHYAPRLAGAVGHSHDLHTTNFIKSRDMSVARIPPRADESDSNTLVSHAYSPF